MTNRMSVPAEGVCSLAWCGDALVDWVGGGERYGLDGLVRPSNVAYSYRFDAAVANDTGEVAVIYERGGTKALVLSSGEVVREINRHFYHADVYDFPVCLWVDRDGRTLIAHCPEEYNRIEIEDAITGERLTASAGRKPVDFFHSRLQVSRGGKRLLSAGWVWHPWDAVCFFDLSEALTNPASLDVLDGQTPYSFNVCLAEESSACWQTDDRLLIGAGSEEEDPEETKELEGILRLRPDGIAVYDIPSKTYISSIVSEAPAGIMMPIGEDMVVAFFDHPRLVSLSDGSVIERWPDLPTGNRMSSIAMASPEPQPQLALDPAHRRFAVSTEDAIHIVEL